MARDIDKIVRLEARTDDAPRAVASDDAVEALIESTVVDRAALIRRCLAALRAAGIPLNLETADCLDELGDRMTVIIEQALAAEDVISGE